MINATAPNVPNQDVSYQEATATEPHPVKKFDQRWYRYFNDTEEFLIALRNAPQQVLQANMASLLSKLIKAQMAPGVQVWVPIYNHMLRFTGTAWSFAPADGGSGYTQSFLSPPTADGWALCDGSTVSYLKGDGAIANQVLPNTAGLYFRR